MFNFSHVVQGEEVQVGSVGTLVVPHEDVGDDYDHGEDLDLQGGQIVTIQRPERHDWVTFFRTHEQRSTLLVQKKAGREFEVEYFSVDPSLRTAVAAELRLFRIVPYYSWFKRRFFLYVTPISEPGRSTWSDSLAVLFDRSPEWHAEQKINLTSDVANGVYRARSIPLTSKPPELKRPTPALLGEALGVNRIIKSAEHPVYQSLLEGETVM